MKIYWMPSSRWRASERCLNSSPTPGSFASQLSLVTEVVVNESHIYARASIGLFNRRHDSVLIVDDRAKRVQTDILVHDDAVDGTGTKAPN